MDLRTLYLISKIKLLGLNYQRIDEIVVRELQHSKEFGLLCFKKNIIRKYRIDLKNNKNVSMLIKYFKEKKGRQFILTYLYQCQTNNHHES